MDRIFAKNFARNYEKKMLGTSDAWSTSCLAQQPSDPEYYIEDWLISINKVWISTENKILIFREKKSPLNS